MAPLNTLEQTLQYMQANHYSIYRTCDTQLHEAYEIAPHHHDCYEIYLFLSGIVDYIVEGKRYHLVSGDLLLVNPMELHRAYITPGRRPYERIVLYVDKAFLESISTPSTSLTRCFDPSQPRHSNLLRLPLAQQRSIQSLMEELLAEQDGNAYGRDLAALSMLVRLLVELNRAADTLPQRSDNDERLDPLITSVLAYINDHYYEDLSLDKLAGLFFVSKYHLSHEFNRLMGTGVYHYIIQKRLVIAKQMLADGLAPTVVYRHCGFGNYTSFYRAFRAEYKTGPKEFAEQAAAARTGGSQRPALGVQPAQVGPPQDVIPGADAPVQEPGPL